MLFLLTVLLITAVAPCHADVWQELEEAWQDSKKPFVKRDTMTLMRCYAKIVDITSRPHIKQKIIKGDNQHLISLAIIANVCIADYIWQNDAETDWSAYADAVLEWRKYCNMPVTRLYSLTLLEPMYLEKGDFTKTKEMEEGYHDALKQKEYGDALRCATYLLAADAAEGKASMENKWLIRGRKLCELVEQHHIRKAFNKVTKPIYEQAEQWRNVEEIFHDDYRFAAKQNALTDTLMDKYSEQIRKELRRKSDQQLAKAVEDSIRRNLETLPRPMLPADTVTIYEAGKDSIQHHIEYVRVRNLRILKWSAAVIAALLLVFGIYALRQRHVRKKRELQRYIEGLEEERNRLAKELHDGVSNQLLAVEMKLNAEVSTDQARLLLSESREQVRRVSHELMPPEFTHTTLDEVVIHYVCELDASSPCDISCHLNPPDADWSEIPPHQALEIYRIIQEALGNALKHADATTIAVGMNKTKEETCFIISDDGKARKTAGRQGIGERTMKQRAASIGGEITFSQGAFGSAVKLVIK